MISSMQPLAKVAGLGDDIGSGATKALGYLTDKAMAGEAALFPEPKAGVAKRVVSTAVDKGLGLGDKLGLTSDEDMARLGSKLKLPYIPKSLRGRMASGFASGMIGGGREGAARGMLASLPYKTEYGIMGAAGLGIPAALAALAFSRKNRVSNALLALVLGGLGGGLAGAGLGEYMRGRVAKGVADKMSLKGILGLKD